MPKFLSLLRTTALSAVAIIAAVWMIFAVVLLIMHVLASLNVILGYNVLYGLMVGGLGCLGIFITMVILRLQRRNVK